MSLVPSSEGFVFEMSGSSVGYLAIGFSDDQLMGNDHIYICTKNSSNTIQVQEAFSTGRVAPIVRSTVSSRKATVHIYCNFLPHWMSFFLLKMKVVVI
ncbi:hypothetical protein FKM82_017921 [Ascaphus truei]